LQASQLDIDRAKFNFLCLKPNEDSQLSHLCFEDIDSEERFKKVEAGKSVSVVIGDYEFVTELTALTYLKKYYREGLKAFGKGVYKR
jgi:hypothetical protein